MYTEMVGVTILGIITNYGVGNIGEM